MESKSTKRALELLRAQHPESVGATENLVNLAPQEGVDKPYLFDLVFDSSALTLDGSSKVLRYGPHQRFGCRAWASLGSLFLFGSSAIEWCHL
jgi:hypothetical protein